MLSIRHPGKEELEKSQPSWETLIVKGDGSERRSYLKQHLWPHPAGERQQSWSKPNVSINRAGKSK